MADVIFTGSGRYSRDFQAVIDRSVAIASLPLKIMQQARDASDKQATALKQLDTTVAALQSSLSAIGSSTGFNSFRANNSNTGLVRASTSEGVREGIYTVQVLALGSYATSLSKAGTAITDPNAKSLTTDAEITLKVWDEDTPDKVKEVTLKPAQANSLNSLADAINGAGAGVQATVINVASTGTDPDYRLSIQTTVLGNKQVQLGDDLLNTVTAGSDVRYKLNGSDEIHADSRTVNLAPGLNVDLVKEGAVGESATITVSRTTDAFKSALQSFISSFNAVVDAVDAHRGNKEAALAGHSILSTITRTLQQMVTSTPGTSTAITSMAQIGVGFTKEGKLEFKADLFAKMTSGKLDELSKFIGVAGDKGFMRIATDAMNSLESYSTGAMKTTIRTMQEQVRVQDQRMMREQDRIDDLITTLQNRMAAADSLIASMEQQVTSIRGVFDAMRINQESMS